jgi:hypothetical protein
MLRDGFRSPHTLSRVVVALLAIGLALYITIGISSIAQLDLLDRAARGAILTPAEVESNDTRMLALGFVYRGAFIASGIAFLAWFHRVYSNVAAYSDRPTEYTPGWAVGAYLVPFINLVRPYEMMREAWDRSAPAGEVVRSPLVGLWWAAWIISNISGGISAVLVKAGGALPALQTMTQYQILDSVIRSAASILAILVVQRQTARQIAYASGNGVSEVFG